MLGPLKNRFGSLPRPPRTLRLAPRRFLTHRVHSQLRLCVKPLGRFWTSGHSQRESFCITGLTSENAGVPTRNGARCRRALFVNIGSTPARQTKSMGLGVFRSCGLLPDAPSRSKPVDGSPIHFYGILSYHPGGSVKGGQ